MVISDEEDEIEDEHHPDDDRRDLHEQGHCVRGQAIIGDNAGLRLRMHSGTLPSGVMCTDCAMESDP